MGDFSISSKMKIYQSSLASIIQGQAPYNASSQLGVYQSSLQDLLNGHATYNFASKIGLYQSDLQSLLDRIGQQGAIGLVLGLLLNGDK